MPLLSNEEREEKLAEIVSRLRAALSPVAIYFFGSYAYGTTNRHSDIDLLVVIEDSPLDVFSRDAIAIRACLRSGAGIVAESGLRIIA